MMMNLYAEAPHSVDKPDELARTHGNYATSVKTVALCVRASPPFIPIPFYVYFLIVLI